MYTENELFERFNLKLAVAIACLLIKRGMAVEKVFAIASESNDVLNDLRRAKKEQEA